MATASQRLAEFTPSLRYEEIPAEVVEAAKLHLLDTLGCGLAAHGLGMGTAGRSTDGASSAASGEATVIGSERALPAANAAFANAMLCHALDFDDTHGGSVGARQRRRLARRARRRRGARRRADASSSPRSSAATRS